MIARRARSSPTQTFVLFPVAVLGAGLLRGDRPRPAWVPVMVAGYLLYRFAREHRHARASGHGFASTPTALVTDGPYAITRNPMYLGQLVFLAGLVGATRSRLALVLFLRQLTRFRSRVAEDEERLERLFGDDYIAYRERVPRWVPAATKGQ